MLLLSFPVCVLYLPSSSSLSRWAFCRPSGMVAPHLTACLRNDKTGEAPPPQSQTTVCNCRPLLSGSSSFCPSRSLCGGRGSCCSTSCKQIHSPAPKKKKSIASAAAADVAGYLISPPDAFKLFATATADASRSCKCSARFACAEKSNTEKRQM